MHRPPAIRRVVTKNNLPVNRITEVRLLDPYFYRAVALETAMR